MKLIDVRHALTSFALLTLTLTGCGDDSAARKEWGWKPRYDLPTVAKDMLTNLSTRLWKDGYGGGDIHDMQL